MTHSKHIGKDVSAQISARKLKTLIDTGWHESRGIRVRTMVVDGTTSEVRKRWFESILFQTEGSHAA